MHTHIDEFQACMDIGNKYASIYLKNHSLSKSVGENNSGFIYSCIADFHSKESYL